MEYSFDIEHAKQYGVDEAIMIKNMLHWIIHNKANNKNLFNERTWTYNSVRAWAIQFPFWTEKQIRRILKSLIDQEVLVSGNFNKTSYDKTKWYAFKNESNFMGQLQIGTKSLCPNGQIDSVKQSNQFVKTGQPIPYTNTCNKHIYIDNGKNKEVITEILEFWNNQKITIHNKSIATRYLKKKHIDIIKEVGMDKIKVAISNYKKVLSGKAYYYSHKYSLWDFIARGAVNFVPEADPLTNYLDYKTKPEKAKIPVKMCKHCGDEASHTESYCLNCGEDYD